MSKKNPTTTHQGIVDHVDQSYAYIIVDGKKSQDVMVNIRNLGGAIHDDRVALILLPSNKKKRQGKVIKILKRKHTEVVGQLSGHTPTLCIPDYKRLYPIIIPSQWNSGETGDKVIVALREWSSTHQQYIGEVIEVLGKNGDYTTENKALSLFFGLNKPFAPVLEDYVNTLPATLPQEETARRRDFSHVPTFTIDPVTAKDFDDAISVQTLPNGHHQIGIHIADVTHYVKEDTPLDKEAFARSTSTYLVDRVVPMLPERLCNDLCSLKPKQTRPALSVVVTFDQTSIVDVWIGETVIYSDKRFTYDEAHAIIHGAKGAFAKELLLLDTLAKHLRQQRMKHHAIAFASDSTKIIFDEATQQITIKPITSTTTHQLIEEFMLLANRLVAETVTKHSKKRGVKTPFIYRIHEDPKPDNIQRLFAFAQHLGYRFEHSNKHLAQTINTILAQSKGTPHEKAIHTLAIRTMEQARYTTKPQGHFGLGFRWYTHFTSPIRRYPDVMVHRFVKHHLYNTNPSAKNYETIAQHTSQRERVAIDAERASINLHQVMFMQQHVGNVFDGIIVGVKAWGLYVSIIENKCEGLVRVADLTDDYYIFDEKKLCLIGTRKKRVYQLGDPITIKVKHCNIQQKNVDFILV